MQKSRQLVLIESTEALINLQSEALNMEGIFLLLSTVCTEKEVEGLRLLYDWPERTDAK